MAPPKVNHFAKLGLGIGAGEDEIKKAFRTLAKQWHPDKNTSPGAEEKFKEINASYEFLSSQDRREIHERELKKPEPSTKCQSAPSYSSGPQPAKKDSEETRNNYSTQSSSKTRPGSRSKSANKKNGAGSWHKSFTKDFGQKKNKTAQGHRPTFTPSSHTGDDEDDFHTLFRTSTHGPTHSDVEDIFNDLFGYMDLFDDVVFSTTAFSAQSSRHPKSRPRNVAPEFGQTAGLDEAYLFTPRSRCEDEKQEACPWCYKMFPKSKLVLHEDKCGKFGLSGDEADDSDDFNSDFDDDLSYFSRSSSPCKTTWQAQHEDLIDRLRKDKQKHKDRVASQGSRNIGFVQCPYCERSFNENAAMRHIPFCKAHLSRYGSPLNPRRTHPFSDPSSPSPGKPKQENVPGKEKPNTYSRNGSRQDQNTYSFKQNNKANRFGNLGKQSPQPRTRVHFEDDLGVTGTCFGAGDYYRRRSFPQSPMSRHTDSEPMRHDNEFYGTYRTH